VDRLKLACPVGQQRLDEASKKGTSVGTARTFPLHSDRHTIDVLAMSAQEVERGPRHRFGGIRNMNDKSEYGQVPGPRLLAPLPPLAPYQRCKCGSCRECHDNQKWDRVFAKFEVVEDKWKTKGFFQSTLRGW
jgi:hypothetical protein